jgi:hypothetical protein
MERMQSEEEAERYVASDKNNIILGGSHFEIGINSGGQPTMGWLDETKRGRATHPQVVIDFVCNHVLNKVRDNTIVGRTEVSLLIGSKKEIFRAHPNYRSDSNQRVNMWYDWAKFERITRHGNRRILPGQIAAFITIKELGEGLRPIPKVRGDELIANTAYAVVRLFDGEPKLNFRESTLGQSSPYTYSVKWGRLKEGFFLVPVEKIVETAIVVPNIEADENSKVDCPEPLDGGFFVLPSRTQLGYDFQDVIERESEGIERESRSGSTSESGSESRSRSSASGSESRSGVSGSGSEGESSTSGSESGTSESGTSKSKSELSGTVVESEGRTTSESSSEESEVESNSEQSRSRSGQSGADSHGDIGDDDSDDSGQPDWKFNMRQNYFSKYVTYINS